MPLHLETSFKKKNSVLSAVCSDSSSGSETWVSLVDLVTTVSMQGKVITAVHLPALDPLDHYRSFKVTPRSQVSLSASSFSVFTLIVSVFICLAVSFTVSVCPSICMSLSITLSLCLSLCLSLSLSVCFSVSLSRSLCLSLSLSDSPLQGRVRK